MNALQIRVRVRRHDAEVAVHLHDQVIGRDKHELTGTGNAAQAPLAVTPLLGDAGHVPVHDLAAGTLIQIGNMQPAVHLALVDGAKDDV